MRWLGFVICALVVLTLQTTVAWRLDWGGLRPDWILVLAVFFALHGRSSEVLIGAWLLGAAADVLSVERFGVLSLCYGLTMPGVFAVREYFFRNHALTHFVLTFLPAVVIGALLWGYRMLLVPESVAGWRGAPTFILLGALYTAAWAPLLHNVLLRFPHLLGIQPPGEAAGRGRRVRA